MYVFIYPLSRIHNTSLISAYFGLDSRECKSSVSGGVFQLKVYFKGDV
jgi:hypothetical protein